MGYVYAGYAVILVVLGAYAASLVVRRRRLAATVDRLAAAGPSPVDPSRSDARGTA